jgi:ribosome-associated protein
MVDEDLHIGPGVHIPHGALRFRAVRSGGPGGQKVNTSSTKVELRVHIDDIVGLNYGQRSRLINIAGRRLTSEGELVVVSERWRTQAQNRRDAAERLQTLIASALRAPRRRKPTKPSRAAKARRLDAKKRRASTKSTRGRVRDHE